MKYFPEGGFFKYKLYSMVFQAGASPSAQSSRSTVGDCLSWCVSSLPWLHSSGSSSCPRALVSSWRSDTGTNVVNVIVPIARKLYKIFICFDIKTHLSAWWIQDKLTMNYKTSGYKFPFPIFIMSVYSIKHQAVIG